MTLQRLGLLQRARRVILRSHGSEHQFAEVMQAAARRGLLELSLQFRARFFGVRLWQVARSLHMSDRVICCTQREADFLCGRLRIAPAKVSVVPHGVAADFFARPLPLAPARKQIVFIGNWVWNKGTRFLRPLLESLRNEHPNVRLVIVTPTASHAQVAADLGKALQPCVTTHSRLSPPEVAALLSESRFMVFPSDYEGFGLVALEAFASGIPVVMTPGVGLAEWAAGRDFSRVVPPEPAALLRECLDLLDQPERALALGAAAREWARDYSWKSAALRTAQVYSQALEEGLAHAS